MSRPQTGEWWLADLGLAAKNRPVALVSRFDPDAPRSRCPFYKPDEDRIGREGTRVALGQTAAGRYLRRHLCP